MIQKKINQYHWITKSPTNIFIYYIHFTETSFKNILIKQSSYSNKLVTTPQSNLYRLPIEDPEQGIYSKLR